jgi:archaellum component FlaC
MIEVIILEKRIEELEAMVMELAAGLNMLRVKYSLPEPSIAAIDKHIETLDRDKKYFYSLYVENSQDAFK